MNVRPDMHFLGTDEFAEPGMMPATPVKPPKDDFVDTFPASEMLRESGIAPFDGDEPEPEGHTWAVIVALLSALAFVVYVASNIRIQP